MGDLFDSWKESVGSSGRHLTSVLGESFDEDSTLERDLFTFFGIPSLDLLLGGALPSGLVEIYGPESSGKTLLAAHLLRQAQEGGNVALYWPTEVDEVPYLGRVGVRTRDVLVAELDEELFSGDRPFNIVFVVDSLNGLVDRFGSHDGWEAGCRDLLGRCRNSMKAGDCLVVISQVRRMRSKGGGFLHYEESASRRLSDLFDVRIATERAYVGEDALDIRVSIVRSQNGGLGGSTVLRTTKGGPIDIMRDGLELAVSRGEVDRRGSSFFYGDLNLGSGWEEASRNLGPILHVVLDNMVKKGHQ